MRYVLESGCEPGPESGVGAVSYTHLYNTQAGADGIGDKTTGFLHNYNSNGNKNIADGIAVFKGTEVDEKSVPCDAVFYGATITTDVYNPAG